ncbi:hypothetical protein LIER_10224 [Lithospermum erythrorhizon]|uniref:DUF3700 domain-containing protein n=1 Tax=Lithospermum erythrorhizon TaxID=34254 RepID=A0AAV3PLD9_LITER
MFENNWMTLILIWCLLFHKRWRPEHPLNELKPVPRVDTSGEMCGATFKVDSEAKKEATGMQRVGSAVNWSQN